MKLPFGIEINWGNKEKGRKPRSRRVLGGLLPNWWYGRELGTDSDYHAQLGAYRHWVYVASSRNAQTVAQVPLRLYVAKPEKTTKIRFPTKEVHSLDLKEIISRSHISNLNSVRKSVNIEEIVEHPILDLMKNVNDFMNGFDLWEITQLHQELTGNAYWLIIDNGFKKPAEIWTLPPDRIKVIPDKEKFVSGYLYEYGTYRQVIPEQNIIHFKIPNPKNLYYGLSPLMAVKEAYSIANKMDEYELSVFENMGRLEGYFSTDNALDDDQFERLKQEIKESYIGHKNAGSAPLFENGINFERFGLTPAELSYKEGRVEIRETIVNAYGQTLGLYSSSANRATAEAAQVQYARQAIRPRCFRAEQKINEKFISRWDSSGKLFVAFDNPVPEDRVAESKIRAEAIRTSQLTINEAREQLRLPPISGADELMFQVQYAPLSAILSGQTLKPANQPSPSADNNKPKKSIENIAAQLAPLVVQRLKKEKNSTNGDKRG